jgi:hypothetical protein
MIWPKAVRRTATPPPIAASALVAAVPTLCPTTIAQACSKVNDPASSATSVVAAAAVELCMTMVMTIPIAASTQRAAAPVPANDSRSHEMPCMPVWR